MSSVATGGLAIAFPRPLGENFHTAKDVKLVGIITSGYDCYSQGVSLGRKKKDCGILKPRGHKLEEIW